MYTYKVVLHPNNKQRTKILRTLNKCIECQNIIYDILDDYIKRGEKLPSCYEIRKMFTVIKKEKDDEVIRIRSNMSKKQMRQYHLDTLFYDVSNDALKQTVKDTYNAFVRYFKKLAKYPNKKSYKDRKKSFYVDPFKIEITHNKVKLEKIANNQKVNRQVLNWIKLAEVDRIPTNVSYYNPRISYDGSNFYLTVSVSDEYAPKKKRNKIENKTIGIDLNIAEIVTSEDVRYKQATKTKKFKKINRRKKRLQRALSRKYLACNSFNEKEVTYSHNFKKNIKIIKKLEKRLTNLRDDCHKRIIGDIFKNPPSKIVIEDLYVKSMTDKKKRKKMTYKEKIAAKNIHTASFRKFATLLIEKANKYNIKVVKANRYFASTKKCSCCGCRKVMEIDERIYRCEECNLVIDRDLNAAINLANYVN